MKFEIQGVHWFQNLFIINLWQNRIEEGQGIQTDGDNKRGERGLLMLPGVSPN